MQDDMRDWTEDDVTLWILCDGWCAKCKGPISKSEWGLYCEDCYAKVMRNTYLEVEWSRLINHLSSQLRRCGLQSKIYER